MTEKLDVEAAVEKAFELAATLDPPSPPIPDVHSIRVTEIQAWFQCGNCHWQCYRRIRFDETIRVAGNQCPRCLCVIDSTPLIEWIRAHGHLLYPDGKKP